MQAALCLAGQEGVFAVRQPQACAGIAIAQKKLCAVQRAAVGIKACKQRITAGQNAVSCGGNQHGGAAAGERQHIGRNAFFGSHAEGRVGRGIPVRAQRTRQAQSMARRHFAQQGQVRGGAGQDLEHARKVIPTQRVAYGAQDHALMVRHMAVYQPSLRARGEIRRLVKALIAVPAAHLHAQQRLARRLGRTAQSQRCRIGGEYVALTAAVQRKLAQTEGLIAVVELLIVLRIAAFGHAKYALASMLLLRAHAGVLCGGQRGTGVAGQQQCAHQIFKHRAAPGKQRLLRQRRPRAAQIPPVLFGRFPCHDSGKGQHHRFAGQ